jgi:VanZ family protein
MPLKVQVRRWAQVALGLIVVLTLALAFLPLDTRVGDNFQPLSHKLPAIRCLLRGGCRNLLTSRPFLVDWVGNVVFFIPLGMALALITWPGRLAAGWRWALRVVLIGALFSAGVELGQLFVPGRATDVDDVILNAIGITMGLVIARVTIAVVSVARRVPARPTKESIS